MILQDKNLFDIFYLFICFMIMLSLMSISISFIKLRMSIERSGEEASKSYRAIEAKLKIVADAVLATKNTGRTPPEEDKYEEKYGH